MEETTMESASAAPSNVLVEQMQSLLDRNYERQGERYDFLFKKLEKRLLTRQIQREQERDEKASQESAALMGELSSLKEAVKKRMISLEVSEITEDWVRSMHGEIEARHDTYHRATSNRLSALEQLLQGLVDSTQQQQQHYQQQQQHRAAAEATAKAQVASAVSDMKKMLEQVIKNQTSLKQDVASLQDVVAANEKDDTTTKLSSLQQQVESVQKTVNTVEMNCTKMKSNVAVVRSVVANIEMKCNQTNNSVKSLGTELSSFIEDHDDVSYVSPGEEDDDDDDSNSDDKDSEEDEEDGIDNANDSNSDDEDSEEDEEDGIDNANDGPTAKKRKLEYFANRREEIFETKCAETIVYVKNHDGFHPPKSSPLGEFFQKLKTMKNNKKRKNLIEDIPGWTWDGTPKAMFYNAKWMKKYSRLKTYLTEHNGTRPPQGYEDVADGFKLGIFAKHLIREFEKDNNEPRVKLIKALPGNNWG